MSRILAVHPVLAAADVGAAVAFFRSLGFTRDFVDSDESPRYAAVSRDGCEIHLQWHDLTGVTADLDRPTYRFLVSDVDALFAAFLAAGATDPRASDSPYAEPRDTPWGTREFHLRDPSGHGLHFYALVSP